MSPSRRKWAVRSVVVASIGAGTLFLFRLTSLSEAHAPPAKPAAAQENPGHELKELEVQLQKKPGHLPVLMRMAQIEHDQGKLEEAAAHLRDAVSSEPGNADAHLELGRVLYEKGDRDEALKETEQALTINPKNVDALYNLGAISANSGNTERAVSYWESAVATAPGSESGEKARDGLSRLRSGGTRR